MSKRPYDDKGRFVPLNCPLLGCSAGKLVLEGDEAFHIWRCDGLLDPEDDHAELEPCWFHHIDREPRVEPLNTQHPVKP